MVHFKSHESGLYVPSFLNPFLSIGKTRSL
jgi:hypothetical protein